MPFPRQRGHAVALAIALSAIGGLALPGTLGLGLRSAAAQEPHNDLSLEASPASRTGVVRRRAPVVLSLIPVGPAVLKIGAPIGFKLTSTASGYAHLYVLDPSGKTQVWLENTPIRKNKPLGYPRAGFTVRATPPSGDETIVFVVSRRPIDGFAGRGATKRPFDAQIPPTAFHDALKRKMSVVPIRDWVSTETRLRVED